MNKEEIKMKERMEKLAPKMYKLLCSIHGNDFLSFDDAEEIEKIIKKKLKNNNLF